MQKRFPPKFTQSTAARFSLFADPDKRPSDPLSPAVIEGGLL
jgi:hypothetical protein